MKSDIWAIGILTCMVLTGYTPFGRTSAYLTKKAIENGLSSTAMLEGDFADMSKDGLNFIQACLTYKPDLRPDA